jgi:hypothetical protein
MRIVVLNSSNLVPDGQNNSLIYKFPNSVLFKGNSIAVSSVSMYYSWFNISSALGNNTFSYTWVNGTTTTTYNVVIPDGLYEISDLNIFLQFTFIENGNYLIDGGGKNVYYGELLLNPTRYAVQVNTYIVPTSAQATTLGYTAPVGFAGFPTTQYNPIFTFNANFSDIVGFSAGFSTPDNTGNAYVPPANQTLITKNNNGTISCLSTQAPNVQPNSSIYFSLSNINNPYSSPSSIIYALVPTGAVGTLIAERPPQFAWNKLIDGTYNELRLQFLGSNFQPIQINDPQMTIMLVIKEAEEYGGK